MKLNINDIKNYKKTNNKIDKLKAKLHDIDKEPLTIIRELIKDEAQKQYIKYLKKTHNINGTLDSNFSYQIDSFRFSKKYKKLYIRLDIEQVINLGIGCNDFETKTVQFCIKIKKK